jgi:hypothetical protein
MHFQVFSHSPLLILPLFALFTFLGVFFSVAIRAFLTAQPVLDSAASLPLAEEGVAPHEA